jgi:pimeloyl-ACP methyl ester carboxylesterase
VIRRQSDEASAALEQKIFAAGSVQLNYCEIAGPGPPLILLHGLARNWRDFLPLFPGLAQHHHLFALDLRGHGISSRVPGGYTIAGYAADIIIFLEQFVAKPVVLFGHSLGGMVGMYIASHRAELVSGLILGDTMLARDAFDRSMYVCFFQTLHSLLLQRTSIADLARRLALAEIMVPGLQHPVPIGDLPGYDEAALYKWAECLHQVDPDTIAMTLSGIAYANFDANDWLTRIKCPTLLLQANPDLGGLMANAEISSALKLLHQPSHQFFPLLGHALHMQNPAPVLDAVISYLDAVR